MDRVHVHFGEHWSSSGSTFARGYAYFGDEFFDADELARYFASKRTEQFALSLSEANGFFAVAHHADDTVLAAVDHACSMPIFHARTENAFFVSDDAYWIVERLGETPYDGLAMTEFLLAGSVTGEDTLDPRVKQLLPGELLVAKAASGHLDITKKAYYCWDRRGYFTNTEDSLRSMLDAVLVRTFRRMIRSVSERPIVVPLSAGYDSRLVAIMLKRLGYKNVTCYSYGVHGNNESSVSQRVARALGFRWIFIPYTHELWYEWFHSEDRKRCIRHADRLSTTPWIQDWPAIRKMKQEEMVSDDSIIVPGHGGDILAGSNIPTFPYRTGGTSMDKVVDYIQKNFCKKWDLEKLDIIQNSEMPIADARSKLTSKIVNSCANMSCQNPQEVMDVFDYWRWKNRSNWRLSLLRGYEFYGYDWRIPFWDVELVSFWRKVPVQFRFGKRLYINYIHAIQGQFGIQQPVRSGSLAPYPQGYSFILVPLRALGLLEPAVKSGLFDFFKISRWKKPSYKQVYYGHPLAWYGIMSIEQFRRIYPAEPESMYSLLAAERLGIISI